MHAHACLHIRIRGLTGVFYWLSTGFSTGFEYFSAHLRHITIAVVPSFKCICHIGIFELNNVFPIRFNCFYWPYWQIFLHFHLKFHWVSLTLIHPLMCLLSIHHSLSTGQNFSPCPVCLPHRPLPPGHRSCIWTACYC